MNQVRIEEKRRGRTKRSVGEPFEPTDMELRVTEIRLQTDLREIPPSR